MAMASLPFKMPSGSAMSGDRPPVNKATANSGCNIRSLVISPHLNLDALRGYPMANSVPSLSTSEFAELDTHHTLQWNAGEREECVAHIWLSWSWFDDSGGI